MDPAKRRRLEARGWRVGTVEELMAEADGASRERGMGLSEAEITRLASQCPTGWDPYKIVLVREALRLQRERIVAALREEADELAEFDEPADASRAMLFMAKRLEREGEGGPGGDK